MKPTIKAKWLTALRSNRYKQGRGQLRSNTSEFCCLGVLCDVVGVPSEELISTYCYSFKDGTRCDAEVPRGFHGISGETAEILMLMNDDDRKSFSEIADWIETNIPTD